MAFDDDSSIAELTGQLGDFLNHELGLRVVIDFERFAVLILRHLFEDFKAVGIKMDHDRVGENLFGPANFRSRLRDELHD